MKNAFSRYSGVLKFYMKVNDDEMKLSSKFGTNGASSLDAIIQNMIISAYSVSKLHLPDTVET